MAEVVASRAGASSTGVATGRPFWFSARAPGEDIARNEDHFRYCPIDADGAQSGSPARGKRGVCASTRLSLSLMAIARSVAPLVGRQDAADRRASAGTNDVSGSVHVFSSHEWFLGNAETDGSIGENAYLSLTSGLCPVCGMQGGRLPQSRSCLGQAQFRLRGSTHLL